MSRLCVSMTWHGNYYAGIAKHLVQDIFFPDHLGQDIFFSKSPGQDIFFFKNHTPPPLDTEWSAPYRIFIQMSIQKGWPIL